METPKMRILAIANKLKGIAMATDNDDMADTLKNASKWLESLSEHICGGGFIGCRGGEDCSSSHK